MFTDHYRQVVHELLGQHRVERHSPAIVKLEYDPGALSVEWEPGDMTRYTAVVVRLPMKNDALQVSGTMQGLPFVMQGEAGGFMSTGYFLEKNAHLRDKLNRYTVGKLTQMVAALMLKEAHGDQVDG